MGSLDVSSAKDHFFKLVDAISASHLPSFTIWLDAKLAEYKTVGHLVPDAANRRNEQYPEWIAKSLRQNLSFILPQRAEDSSNLPAQPSSPRRPHKRRLSNSSASESHVATSDVSQKRRFISPPETSDRVTLAQSEVEHVVVIKEEADVSDASLTDFQDGFSLTSEALPPVAPEDSNSNSAFPSLPGETMYHVQASSSSSLPTTLQSMSNAAAASSDYQTPDQHSTQIALPEGKPALSSLQSSPSSQLKPGDWVPFLSHFQGSRSQRGAAIDKPKSMGRKIPAPCSECGRECRDNYTMKRHLMTHSQGKPYFCPYCERRFNISSNCYAHQKLKHRDKPVLKVSVKL